jgi:ATP-binding cassette subfamily C protein
MTAAIFSAAVNILYLAPTLYMLQVYDRVLPTGGVLTLVLLSAVMFLALGVLNALEGLRSRLLIRAGARIEGRLAGRVMRIVLGDPAISRGQRLQAMRELDHFRQGVTGPAATALFDLVWTPIYLAAAFMLHPVLGGAILAGGVVMAILAITQERATKPLILAANEAASDAYATQDTASGQADTARALGMVDALTVKGMAEREKANRLNIQASMRSGVYVGLIKFIRLALQSGMLGLGAYLAIERQISAGAVIASTLLLTRALGPIEQIVGAWKSILQTQDSLARLSALLESEKVETRRTRLPAPTGVVSVEQLSAFVQGADQMILSDITFAIEPGQVVGVVGPSGAGKSTLARILAGAALPQRGAVRLDGAATTDWEQEQLARHVGYLPQEFSLLPGSLKDNISRFRAFGDKPGADIDAAVVAAAKAAGAHEMIVRLPAGYDTVVGQGGARLSTGQAQRIALARALYGEPHLVVLDEPNAHLDTEGEMALNAALSALKARGAAVLIIAHRLAALAEADKVLRLQAGRVAGFGTLEDMLQRLRASASNNGAAARPQPQPTKEGKRA